MHWNTLSARSLSEPLIWWNVGQNPPDKCASKLGFDDSIGSRCDAWLNMKSYRFPQLSSILSQEKCTHAEQERACWCSGLNCCSSKLIILTGISIDMEGLMEIRVSKESVFGSENFQLVKGLLMKASEVQQYWDLPRRALNGARMWEWQSHMSWKWLTDPRKERSSVILE